MFLHENWNKLVPEFTTKTRNAAPRVPWGRPKSLQRWPRGGPNRSQGCPAQVSKNRSPKKHSPARKNPANWYQMGSEIETFLVFLIIYFNSFPHHFWNWFLMNRSTVLWSILVSFSCLIWTSSGIFLKPADLDKSAPRLHGSMFLEVLALRFLMVFSCFVCDCPC